MSAWIEIKNRLMFFHVYYVALYMSAWIEIGEPICGKSEFLVALYMSAWIEILRRNAGMMVLSRRTLYECAD